MVISQARLVGRLDRPKDTTWDDVIASAVERARLIASFLALAAPALAVKFDRVRVFKTVWMDGSQANSGKQARWHQDACGSHGHVVCVLGERATEFLLGEYPEQYLDNHPEIASLEGKLTFWQPEPGDLVLIDRATVHRRPRSEPRPRMWLMGAAEGEGGGDYARGG